MSKGICVRTPGAAALAAAGLLGLTACAVDGTVTQQREVTVSGPDAAAETVMPRPVGHGKDAFLANYDADGNGAVPRAEFDRVRRAGYDRRDADGDGAVSRSEYLAEFTTRFIPEDGEDYQRQMRQTRSRFDVLDDDADGALSWAEFADSGEFVFTSLDSNGDGAVDAADEAESY